MYSSHWGLVEPPFRNRLDPRFFHPSPTHEEALARLHFLVDDHRRLGLLLGAHGSGKSLLLEVFAQTIRRVGWPVARLGTTGLDSGEFLGELALQFGLFPEPGMQPGVLWPAITDRICEYRYQQLPTVILLDDADLSDGPVLSQISRLVQIDQSPESRLTVVLAAHPEQVSRLGEGLLERVELKIDLEPWGPEETADYLNATLAKAGRETPLFAESAVALLHRLSRGVPRRVSQLADLALLAGAGQELETIDAETVESVYRELGAVEV